MAANFIKHFSEIEDPRVDRLKRHDLSDILFLCLCAVLSGAEGWEDIEDFGRAKEGWLKRYLPFRNGIPSHDTIARVMSRLKPDQVHSCFISWVSGMIESGAGDVIAIDGKTARRSFTTRERQDALHMVSAWSSRHRLVLGQQRVDDKSNEITAIPHLLKVLDIADTIITIDAMGCQKSIASLIVKQKADYVLALKGNHAGLQKELEAWIHKAQREKFKGLAHEELTLTDSGHGRIEVRRCLQLEVNQGWLDKSHQWAGLRSVIQVESEVHIANKVTSETRYYISSLAVNAQQAMQAVRSHWQVESMHWMLDMTFKEDESRIRRGHAAEIFNVLRKLALNTLKTDTVKKASIKRKLKQAALSDEYRAELIRRII